MYLLTLIIWDKVVVLVHDYNDYISCGMGFVAVIWWDTALFGTIPRWWIFRRKEFCF